jgi:hypothetical protein
LAILSKVAERRLYLTASNVLTHLCGEATNRGVYATRKKQIDSVLNKIAKKRKSAQWNLKRTAAI